MIIPTIVVDWNKVGMIIEPNPGGMSPNRKNHNTDPPLARLSRVEIILELVQKTSIA